MKNPIETAKATKVGRETETLAGKSPVSTPTTATTNTTSSVATKSQFNAMQPVATETTSLLGRVLGFTIAYG